MNLTPEISYIQEKLVLAAHPGLDLYEALEIEYKNMVCMGICNDQVGSIIHKYEIKDRPEGTRIIKIIGLPPSLQRILNVLNHCEYSNRYRTIYHSDRVCYRAPTDINGNEITLFEQSNETIIAIAREMGYKSE